MARAKALQAAAMLAFAISAALASPAMAEDLSISEFETTSSNSEACGHPNLEANFRLGDAASPEIAKTISFDLPRGMSGNPNVLAQCTPVDFALTQCSPSAQAGSIIVRADYEGDPNYLLGMAPIYNVEPGGDEAARFAF